MALGCPLDTTIPGAVEGVGTHKLHVVAIVNRFFQKVPCYPLQSLDEANRRVHDPTKRSDSP